MPAFARHRHRHRQRFDSQGGLQAGQMAFGNGKGDIDRLDLVQNRQRGIVGLDRRARRYLLGANDAGEGRLDRGVIPLQARGFDGRSVGTRRGRQRVNGDPSIRQLLVGYKATPFQGQEAIHIALRLGELGLVAGQIRLSLLQAGVEIRRIKSHQHVARCDRLPFEERQGCDLAIHPCLERHALISLRPPDQLQYPRHVLNLGLGD